MRGIFIDNWCDPTDLVLKDVPDPALPADHLRIAIKASGVNFADGLIIKGKYQEKPAFPFAPGFEIAGTVIEIGAEAGSFGFSLGQDVFASVPHSGFADQAVVRAADIHAMPKGMDYQTAAGFPIAYGTSHFALIDRAKVQPGETVLVHGAAGGVGLTAVECAKAAGATVIATARGADRLAVAAEHGADHVIDTKELKTPLAQQVKALTDGRGVDVVYDPVGGDLFLDSIRCTAPDGRLLVIGFAAGTIQQIPANLLLVKNLSVIGLYWGAYRDLAPDRMRASFDQLRDWYERGLLRPHVSHTFPLSHAAEAIAALQARKVTGKAVLLAETPDESAN